MRTGVAVFDPERPVTLDVLLDLAGSELTAALGAAALAARR
jgi:hypothetical protein